jgi:hypothetical protein
MPPKATDKSALQQCNPELGNMLRQVEMLKSLSEQAPTDATIKRAMPYLYTLAQNLATVFYHLHGHDVGTGKEFTRALISVLSRASASEGAILRTQQQFLVIDGVFDLPELMKFMVVSPAPVEVDGED